MKENIKRDRKRFANIAAAVDRLSVSFFASVFGGRTVSVGTAGWHATKKRHSKAARIAAYKRQRAANRQRRRLA